MFRGSKIPFLVYFLSPIFFLVGISWGQNLFVEPEFFHVGISWVQNCFLIDISWITLEFITENLLIGLFYL